MDVAWLAGDDPLRRPLLAVARAALEDQGIGVCGIERDGAAGWRRRPDRHDRRVHGLTGLDDPSQRLRCSGLAALSSRRELAVPDSDRSRPGSQLLRDQAGWQAYRDRFAFLGDLYPGGGDEQPRGS